MADYELRRDCLLYSSIHRLCAEILNLDNMSWREEDRWLGWAAHGSLNISIWARQPYRQMAKYECVYIEERRGVLHGASWNIQRCRGLLPL